MPKLRSADFYYGAVLSLLINNGAAPALVENGEDRQVYDVMTNKNSRRIFIKYRACKQPTKTKDYSSWSFPFPESDQEELEGYINDGHNLLMVLVCGLPGLKDSELAIVDSEQLKEIMEMKKTSMTISRKKHERVFMLSIGGGRSKSLRVASNNLEDFL